ncbi:complex I subunit 5 family protein [Mycobacterium sp. SMC-4]|uniref:complex I subunit 5 family protein n=1 Tax=Mycobacterium sp. SMC-4 TaxID=2857059 RepID=UPI0021B2E733|nr:proton-conducting transporter membrane subunit [Mycobacterium sp. SMC-4]UXA18599.1 monovalent cation/H+ antiporter subunit D family protein [Mycobacterium sp. SMC-4]
MTGSLLPLAVLATSLIPGVVIFALPERARRTRVAFNLAGAIGKVVLVAALIPAAAAGARFEFQAPFVPGIDLVLRVEPFALYFLALSAVLWLLTTIYAIGYLGQGPHLNRFFGFFSLCVLATSGIALSGNLTTFVIFFELLTLVTYPLVVHEGTPAAVAGGRTYLAYTLTGGVVLLLGVVWLTATVGPVDFTDRGSPALRDFADQHPLTATAIFVLILAGLGVKAALVPLHGWLPRAMVAPAPVSALLHAVAVVKAGVFGVVLLVDYVYGVELAEELGVLTPLAVLASVTIIYGSVQALRQDGLKARLAYSTVSQVAYVTLGVSVASVLATTGGIAHIVNQGFMKITMFFCAGLFATVLGLSKVSELDGVGRRMPVTATAFTIAVVGMVGIPPLAGFLSKWYLAGGAVETGQGWILAVLITSSLLNALYFFPIVYRLWWKRSKAAELTPLTGLEAAPSLVLPTATTALLVLGIGVVAGWPYSPLELARLITEGIYGQ